MATYGNTWWGKQWLNSLAKIDDDNRLPRGRTYANKGAVLDVKIDNNKLKAKVQGSRSLPYRQVLTLHLFTPNEVATILDVIRENPFILSKLLAREMPETLLEKLGEKNIRLFPVNWADIEAECTCPDYALPCKHMAAVIYKIANEIDQNPFLIFQLHGLDLPAELEKAGIGKKGAETLLIPVLPDDWQKVPFSDFEHRENPYQGEGIDYSVIPPSKEPLLGLLEANPIFYQKGNFKETVARYFKEMEKTGRFYQTLQEENFEGVLHEKYESFRLLTDDGTVFTGAEWDSDDDEGEINFPFRSKSLVLSLAYLHESNLPNHAYAIGALYEVYRFTLALMQQGALVPQLITLGNREYFIRWVPAQVIEEVDAIFQQLSKTLPPDLLIAQKGKKQFFCTEEEMLRALVAGLVHQAMQDWAMQNDEHYYQVFFNGQPFIIDSFDLQEIPQSIQRWVQRFYLKKKEFLPVLKVDDEDGDFAISFLVEGKGDILKKPLALDKFLKTKEFTSYVPGVLQDLVLLSHYFPQVEKIVNQKGKGEIRLDAEAFVPVFFEILPVIRLLGIRILLPKALQKLVRPQLSKSISSKGKGKGFLNLDDMLSFNWQIAMGDQQMDPAEFLKLVKQSKGIVKLNDQYVYLDEKEVASLLKKLEKPPKLNGHDLLRAALTGKYEGAKVTLDSSMVELIREIMEEEKVPLPKGLKATLRPYQVRGYAWLYKNARIGFGSLLADDMGLGKTLQVIAYLLKCKEEGTLEKNKALVIAPTTLLTNWQKELRKFAPALTAYIYHGTGRKAIFDQTDVVLTTYGIVRSEIDTFQKTTWHTVAIDEAQNIKNNDTAQTKSVKKLKVKYAIAMSGTPVENRLSEYWSLFDFTNKGLLGPFQKFSEQFIKPIELQRSKEVLEQFRNMTAPFVLRRVKTDKSIIQDLPDKIETNQYCLLTKEQTALYQNILDLSLKSISGEDKTFNRQGLIFKMMVSLKQICNHPANFLKKGDHIPDLSGKAQVLMELLDNIHELGEKALIFTQYKEMGDLLVQMIGERYQHAPMFLHGGCSRQQRDQMVEDFQHKSQRKVMILSLKAGGTGLNLTSANHVVHYDLWWNPAVEAQATDRAFRIGQQKNVLVNRLITKGTFEEKIDEMIRSKKELADLTVGTGEKWIGELNNEELRAIFKLEKGN